jgi:hypothetical protein
MAKRWSFALAAPAHRHKVEGVNAQMSGDVLKLLLVTDADDDMPQASSRRR